MTRELYLVRHGQTMFNEKRIIQGWCDSPLTKLGREQAHRVRSLFDYEGCTFDHVYASPTGRTRETVACITDAPCVFEDNLRELFFGAYEGERDCVIPPMPWNDFFVPFGGESLRHLEERMCAVLCDIMSRPDHERVLAVSHGTASEVFLDHWSAYNESGFQGLPGNCAVMHFTFDRGCFSLKRVVEQSDMQSMGL